ncbi:hypothetical protein BH11ARM1_BH11ARM1_05380 [soil metagenome]
MKNDASNYTFYGVLGTIALFGSFAAGGMSFVSCIGVPMMDRKDLNPGFGSIAGLIFMGLVVCSYLCFRRQADFKEDPYPKD